jgi:hypothetical protein
MNFLEYFKLYPVFRDKLHHSDAAPALQSALAEMDSMLAQYIPENIDRRTEYRLSDEKAFIKLHCIEGKSVEKTAEDMCISRDTAYRIRRRLCNKQIDGHLTATNRSTLGTV